MSNGPNSIFIRIPFGFIAFGMYPKFTHAVALYSITVFVGEGQFSPISLLISLLCLLYFMAIYVPLPPFLTDQSTVRNILLPILTSTSSPLL